MVSSLNDRSITFLGTGPSNPITDREGKSNRQNTSTLIKYRGIRYLIDIPKYFKDVDSEYLLLTHLHKDAFGGYSKGRTSILGIPKELEKDIPKKLWKPLPLNKCTQFGDLKVTTFKVKHDLIYNYPTFGYHIVFPDNFKMIYASDMVGIPEEAEKYFKKLDLAIVDGAGWKSNLATHFGIKPFLNLVQKKRWAINKICFVQIGRPVPDHDQAHKEITKINKSAYLAYDNLRITF